jgi:hypothetical protein
MQHVTKSKPSEPGRFRGPLVGFDWCQYSAECARPLRRPARVVPARPRGPVAIAATDSENAAQIAGRSLNTSGFGVDAGQMRIYSDSHLFALPESVGWSTNGVPPSMTSAHRHPPPSGASDTAGFRLPLASTLRVGTSCTPPGQRRWRQRGDAAEGATVFQPASVRRHPRGGACGSWRYSPGHPR